MWSAEHKWYCNKFRILYGQEGEPVNRTFTV